MRDSANENINAGNVTQRISWVDNAKALGIIAVFYGHIVAKIFTTYGFPTAGLQYKLIYSFHMPLFFLLSGYIVKRTQHRKLFMFMKNKFMTRIVPFFFFNILLVPFLFIFSNISNQSIDVSRLFEALLYLPTGLGGINHLTWFLSCLFSVEVINYFLYPVLRKSRIVLCIAMVLFYIMGWSLSYKAFIINQYITIPIYWYIRAVPVVYSFYLFGNLIATFPIFHEKVNPYLNGFLLILTAVCVLTTFNLNNVTPALFIAIGRYGSFLLFPLTALAGSIFIILVSRIMPSFSFMSFLGRNTLSLMGLNYIFLLFTDFSFNYCSLEFTEKHFALFMQCASLTCITLLLCVPLVIFLKRYLPFMIGYRKDKDN